MKPETILYAINDIESEFLIEARAEYVPQHHRSRRFAILIAAVIALMAIAVTAFAAEEVAGWFRRYFAGQSEVPLSPGQIAFLEENEQIIAETLEHNGYRLELKSVLSDSNAVYAIVGITAPADVTEEDLRSLWPDIDFYDKNRKPVGSWGVKLHIGMDGKKNTAALVFELNPTDWNSGNAWTLRVNRLSKMVHNKEYEQELLNTKYAGQENIMFTDEEAAKIHQQVILAEGPWEFTIDLRQTNNTELEIITMPVTAQTCYGYKPDGTEVLEEVQITSFILRPLGATIKAESTGALDFTYNADQHIYVVMINGNRIELLPNWGTVGEQHLGAEAPIILDEVDHVLLSDGTKLMVP